MSDDEDPTDNLDEYSVDIEFVGTQRQRVDAISDEWARRVAQRYLDEKLDPTIGELVDVRVSRVRVHKVDDGGDDE